MNRPGGSMPDLSRVLSLLGLDSLSRWFDLPRYIWRRRGNTAGAEIPSVFEGTWEMIRQVWLWIDPRHPPEQQEHDTAAGLRFGNDDSPFDPWSPETTPEHSWTRSQHQATPWQDNENSQEDLGAKATSNQDFRSSDP